MKVLEFEVDGMMCNKCIQHVEEALSNVPGVRSAKADLSAGTATIEANDEVTPDSIVGVIAEEGYTAKLKANS